MSQGVLAQRLCMFRFLFWHMSRWAWRDKERGQFHQTATHQTSMQQLIESSEVLDDEFQWYMFRLADEVHYRWELVVCC